MQAMAGHVLLVALAALSLLHLYWGLGGRRGLDQALPRRPGKPLRYPAPIVTLCVAAGLAACALPVSECMGYSHLVPRILGRTGARVLAAVFFLRAIGDFRFVGFSKRIRDTEFARWDSRVYSPFCLFLSVCFVLVSFRP
jgi:hypothetical protein